MIDFRVVWSQRGGNKDSLPRGDSNEKKKTEIKGNATENLTLSKTGKPYTSLRPSLQDLNFVFKDGTDFFHICRIIPAFWLIFTYDLLKDKRIDDAVHIFFLLY